MKIGQYISTMVDTYRYFKFKLSSGNVNEKRAIAPFGIDSVPVKDMGVVVADTRIKGKGVIVGVFNKSNEAAEGETRIYSVDSDNVVQNYIHVKSDGTIEIGGNTDNMVRYSELETAFDQLKSDFDDLVTVFNAHTHLYAPGPGSPTPTAAPATTGTPSTADITGAKINEIKTN